MERGTPRKRRGRTLRRAVALMLGAGLILASCDLPYTGSHVPKYPKKGDGGVAVPLPGSTDTALTICDFNDPISTPNGFKYFCRVLAGVEEFGYNANWTIPAGLVRNSNGSQWYGVSLTTTSGKLYEGCDLTQHVGTLNFRCDYRVIGDPKFMTVGGGSPDYLSIFTEWAQYEVADQAICAAAVGSAVFGSNPISPAIGRKCGYGPWPGP